MARTKPRKKTNKKKPQIKVEKPQLKKQQQQKKKSIVASKKETIVNESANNSPGETESEMLHKLLEPYTKDQLVNFLLDAAIKDASVYNRILATADSDVSHRKIFVFGLGWDTTRETLASAFETYGEIEDCNVVIDRVTGKAKGFGFVLFKSRQATAKALKQPRKKINNRFTSCQLASTGPAAGPQTQSFGNIGRKIYVSNVQADVDPEKLRAFFAQFGEIEIGPIGFDMHTGKSRGFALFVYKTQEGASKVLEDPHKLYEGHQLHCQKATEGKNKAAQGASVTTAMQPMPQMPPSVMAATAAHNLALYNQQASLNPMYSGLFANQNPGFIAAGSLNQMVPAGGFNQGVIGSSQVGAAGMGGYGASTSHGIGNFGANSSVLGMYGTIAPGLQSLQQAYPSSQIGLPSSGRGNGIGGSFSGYPSYM